MRRANQSPINGNPQEKEIWMDRSHSGEGLTTTLADQPSGKINIRKTKDNTEKDQWIEKLKKKK